MLDVRLRDRTRFPSIDYDFQAGANRKRARAGAERSKTVAAGSLHNAGAGVTRQLRSWHTGTATKRIVVSQVIVFINRREDVICDCAIHSTDAVASVPIHSGNFRLRVGRRANARALAGANSYVLSETVVGLRTGLRYLEVGTH